MKKKTSAPETPVPKVRICRPSKRSFEVRYIDPQLKREVRISVRSRDERKAKDLQDDITYHLRHGIPIEKKSGFGSSTMSWDEFREKYRCYRLVKLREKTVIHTESRLDIATRIIKPKKLADMAHPENLDRLSLELSMGSHSRNNKPRSPVTVNSYMKTVLASLAWAHRRKWLKDPPLIEKVDNANQNTMKGRPLLLAEFERLLISTSSVVGDAATESWQYLLKGLWESGFRLGEIMNLSWDDDELIRPIWHATDYPILHFPGTLQKNGKEEFIPLLPGFEKVLLETPVELRKGWVFNPKTLWDPEKRKQKETRLSPERVGKVITRIGITADVLVRGSKKSKQEYLTWWRAKYVDKVDPKPYRGEMVKFASAHDLRRSCAERMRSQQVSPLIIMRIMRHSSWDTTMRYYAPGVIQNEAAELRKLMGTNDK